jgi:NDP-sugar pyrophosphorylase family protein
MISADLYIVAAGEGSRMKANVPKALIPISEEPCLTTTLQQVGHKFKKVFLISNILVQSKWSEYFRRLEHSYPELASHVVNLPIASGLGDGHATFHGILAAERIAEIELAPDMVVVWGDVFIPNGGIVDELLSISPESSGLLPAVREANPYVSLVVNEKMQCMAAELSKYGETRATGLHDQSIFRFCMTKLRASLFELHRSLWKNGRYISPGGELSLLYTFHQLYNSGDPAYVYETQYPTMSFNTIEEVSEIQRDISSGWRQTVPDRNVAP